MSRREPALRVVLLGASNLKMGFPRLLSCLPGPVEVLAALGHGRSFGTWSRLAWVRQLPGILQCGIWDELERRHRRQPLPTVAVVTDVGNDLLYGAPARVIEGWVRTCLERLSRYQAEPILGLLPLASLEKVSAFRYHLARSILFPGRRAASWSAMLESARELNGRLRSLSLEHGARIVEPSPAWYGMDPIHVRRKMRKEAWTEILRHPRLAGGGNVSAGRLPLFGAAELKLFGRTLRNPQPVCRFEDGSTVALY